MHSRLLVILLLVLAALVRIDFLLAIGARLDSDEAIVGLMAKHIVEGQPIPTFYYGQHYMGSFEALVVALGFIIFGTSAWVLQAVPLAFSILFLWLLYLLALELVSKRAALFTLMLGALPPATLIIWSTKARGGFIEVMCIGTAALLTSVHWLKQPTKRSSLAIFTGLLLGFGWWVNNQIIYFMLPIALLGLLTWISERMQFRLVLKNLLLGLTAFFVGGSAYWLYNIEKGFPSLGMFNLASGEDTLSHLFGVVQTAIPILLGGKRFWHEQELYPGSVALVWVLVVACLVTLWKVRSSEIKNFFRGRIDLSKPFELIPIFLMGCITVFSVSSFGYLVQAPRYLLPAYTGLLILAGFTIDQQLLRKNRILACLIFGGFLWLNWASSFIGGRAVPGEPYVFEQQRVSKDHSELIKWLSKHNHTWVRTNYWIGYRLAFETNEQVRFLVFGEPHETRIPEYQIAGKEYGKNQMPLVLVGTQADYVLPALLAQGYKFNITHLSGYTVVFDIEPLEQNLIPIAKQEFTLRVSDRAEYADLAVDRDLSTRWRTARHQEPGMSFEVVFNRPRTLRGIKYDTGEWPHDYPRGLAIELVFANGSSKLLYETDKYAAIRYYLHGDTTLMFYLNQADVVSVKLLQVGSHPVFDWSIAELTTFE